MIIVNTQTLHPHPMSPNVVSSRSASKNNVIIIFKSPLHFTRLQPPQLNFIYSFACHNGLLQMEKSLRTCTQHAFWKTCIIPQDIHKSTIKQEFMVIQQRNVVIENPFVMHMQEVYNISLNYKMVDFLIGHYTYRIFPPAIDIIPTCWL